MGFGSHADCSLKDLTTFVEYFVVQGIFNLQQKESEREEPLPGQIAIKIKVYLFQTAPQLDSVISAKTCPFEIAPVYQGFGSSTELNYGSTSRAYPEGRPECVLRLLNCDLRLSGGAKEG